MGVEMEVLIVVSVVVFMLYDMIKVVDLGVFIDDIWVFYKEGGCCGIWMR